MPAWLNAVRTGMICRKEDHTLIFLRCEGTICKFLFALKLVTFQLAILPENQACIIHLYIIYHTFLWL
jgi:hypothetical protein